MRKTSLSTSIQKNVTAKIRAVSDEMKLRFTGRIKPRVAFREDSKGTLTRGVEQVFRTKIKGVVTNYTTFTPTRTQYIGRSKYLPHQGKQECARRVAQAAKRLV